MSPSDVALFLELVEVLASTFTVRGHVAIRNEREGLGYCRHDHCAPLCQERQRLVIAATDRLAALGAGHVTGEEGTG